MNTRTVVVAAALLAACTPKPNNSNNPTRTRAQARVVLPVPGTALVRPAVGALVRITRSTVTTRTDADGHFSLGLLAGHDALIITHQEGSTALSARVNVTQAQRPGAEVDLGDIPLGANGAVNGRTVLDANAEPAGVQVVAVGLPGAVLTNLTGEFQLDNLPPGPTPFAAVKPGFLPAQFNGTVAAGTLTTLLPATLVPRVGAEPARLVLGSVRLEDATIPAGVTIMARGADGVDVNGTSNTDGHFEVGNIRSPLITLWVQKDGYSTLVLPFLLVPDDAPLDVGELVLGTGEPSIAPGSSSGPMTSSSGRSGSSSNSSNAGSSASSPASSTSATSNTSAAASTSGISGSGTPNTSSGGGSSNGSGGSGAGSTQGASSGSGSSSGVVLPPSCDNNIQDPNEDGVDCGGSCRACPGTMCGAPQECESQQCINGTCARPTCSDNIQNGAETDQDCGGADCAGCAGGKHCSQSTDCDQTSCVQGTCVVARRLTVTVTGPGGVTSTPPGLNCNPTCTADFEVGTQVTLHAQHTPVVLLDGFTGDCTGSTCTVTLTADATVAASFTSTRPFVDQGTFLLHAGTGSFNDQGCHSSSAMAPNGDIYLTGCFTGAPAFPLGTMVSNARDVFLMRFDAAGTPLWQLPLGGAGNERAVMVHALPSGDAVVLAQSDPLSPGNTYFGNPLDTFNCEANGILVGRFSSDGAYQYGGCFGSNLFVHAARPDGVDILVNGSVAYTADLGDGTMHTAAGEDLFVMRVDTMTGLPAQTAVWDGTGSNTFWDVAVYPDGSSIHVGQCEDQNRQGVVIQAPARPSTDACVWRLRPDLSVEWGHGYGGNGTDGAQAVAVRPNGNVVVSGFFEASAYFEPPPRPPLQSAGDKDIFLMELAPDGSGPSWARTYGAAGRDVPEQVAVLDQGLIFMAGVVQSGVTLDGVALQPGSFTATFSPLGGTLWGQHQQSGYSTRFDQLTAVGPGVLVAGMGSYCSCGATHLFGFDGTAQGDGSWTVLWTP